MRVSQEIGDLGGRAARAPRPIRPIRPIPPINWWPSRPESRMRCATPWLWDESPPGYPIASETAFGLKGIESVQNRTDWKSISRGLDHSWKNIAITLNKRFLVILGFTMITQFVSCLEDHELAKF